MESNHFSEAILVCDADKPEMKRKRSGFLGLRTTSHVDWFHLTGDGSEIQVSVDRKSY